MEPNAKVTNYHVIIHMRPPVGEAENLEFDGDYFDMCVAAGACESLFHCPHSVQTEIKTEEGETFLLEGFLGDMIDCPIWRFTCIHCGHVDWYDRPIGPADIYVCYACTMELPKLSPAGSLLN